MQRPKRRRLTTKFRAHLKRLHEFNRTGLSGHNRVLRSYRRAARLRGYAWKLSRSQFYLLLSMACFYCGCEPSSHYAEHPGFKYNGVDRFINSRGYTMTNCVPCCGTCNDMKGTIDGPEFLEQVRLIAQRRPHA